MTSNTPPSPNFTGINFNTDFFPSSAGDYVEYPVAQGPTTIDTLYSSVIDTLSSSTVFNLLNSLTANLNIAINGGAGQTIRIGAITGASVHCANIDHQGNSINNSTNASGGTINLCNSMTSGTLNIATNTGRTGTLNIGNGAGATGTIDIGSSTTTTTLNGTSVKATTKLTTPIIDCVTDASAGSTSLSIGPSAVNGDIIIGAALGAGDVKIGAAQTAGGTITLGSASTATTNSGTLTSTGLITANGNIKTTQLSSDGNLSLLCNNVSTMSIGTSSYSNINIGASGGSGAQSVNIYNCKVSLPEVSYTPTSSQLGYSLTGSLGSVTAIGTTGKDLVSTSNLPIGKYIVTFSVTFNNFSLTTGMFLGYSFTVSNCSQQIQYQQTPGSINVSGVCWSGVLTVTNATNSCIFRPNTSAGTVDASGSGYTVIKIA